MRKTKCMKTTKWYENVKMVTQLMKEEVSEMGSDEDF